VYLLFVCKTRIIIIYNTPHTRTYIIPIPSTYIYYIYTHNDDDDGDDDFCMSVYVFTEFGYKYRRCIPIHHIILILYTYTAIWVYLYLYYIVMIPNYLVTAAIVAMTVFTKAKNKNKKTQTGRHHPAFRHSRQPVSYNNIILCINTWDVYTYVYVYYIIRAVRQSRRPAEECWTNIVTESTRIT